MPQVRFSGIQHSPEKVTVSSGTECDQQYCWQWMRYGDRTTPQDNYFSAQELEQATNEVARLAEECDALSVRLAEEEIRRAEAELKLQAAEERMMVTEQEVREECWAEMEQRIEDEKQRWRSAWEEEKDCGESSYVDGKLEIMPEVPAVRRSRVFAVRPSRRRDGDDDASI